MVITLWQVNLPRVTDPRVIDSLVGIRLWQVNLPTVTDPGVIDSLVGIRLWQVNLPRVTDPRVIDSMGSPTLGDRLATVSDPKRSCFVGFIFIPRDVIPRESDFRTYNFNNLANS